VDDSEIVVRPRASMYDVRAKFMTPNTRIAGFAVCLLVMVAGCGAEERVITETSGRVITRVPEKTDPAARYLFYLHGAIIEREGLRPTHPKFGVYEYQRILEEFSSHGFVVISKARPAGTEVAVYAATVAEQVRALLAAGVSPERITVVGFSKGGAIAIFTSSLTANDRINFVFIATCGPWLDAQPGIVPRGRLLAIREASDDLVGSCEVLFSRSPEEGVRREVTLELGGGHGAFYRPRPAWIDPVVAWASFSAP
jgi:predicted esterase